MTTMTLDHFLQQFINLVLSAAEVTTLNEVVDLLSPSTSGSVQFKWPQEVRSVLEVGTNVQDLMNQIFNTNDSKLSEGSFNDVIGGDGSTVAVDLHVSTLVDELTNRLKVRSTPSDIRLSCLS